LADHRVKKSQAQIEAALTGDYRPEMLFVLNQALENYRHIQQQIAQCDLGIEKQLAQIADCPEPCQASEPTTPPLSDSTSAKPRKTKPKDALELSLAGHLKRILGVDLTAIPGLNVLAVLTLLGEIGTNMTKWRNEKAFVSWLGLSTNNKISGQRVLSSRTRKVANHAATTLRLVAMVLGHSNTRYCQMLCIEGGRIPC
jgi:transposase